MLNLNLPLVFSLLARTSISAPDKFTHRFLHQGGIKCMEVTKTNNCARG